MGLVSFLAMRTMNEGVRLVAAQRARYGLQYVRATVEDIGNANMVDRDHLQTSLERLTVSPDIDAARILSADGKVLYSSRPAEIGQILAAHLPASLVNSSDAGGSHIVERANVLHASGKIVNQRHCQMCHSPDRTVLAYLDIDVSLSRQSAGMRTWGTMATAATIVQFGAIGLGVVLILSFVVVRPITRLSESMSQVQHGNLEVTAVPAGNGEINRVVDGFNDMVARLRRARQVEQETQRKHLARVEQLATLGEVAASLVHEIRNPLSGTKAAVDVLASEEQAEEPRRILRHVSEELRRVDGVVRQLLDYSKPKAPVVGKVDLKTLIDDAIRLASSRAAAQGAVLVWQRRSEPLEVRADADMVLQVIVNLFINALHAAQGVTDATVVLSTNIRDGRIACTVRDNGPGVPADKAHAIFKPFVTTKAKGTGLGLATSRRLIELQGGQLTLDNPGQAGASFTFTLPTFTEPEPARA